MNLYKVTAKCGHVGKGHFVIKNFPVKACNGKEAAKVARNFPRVKHHHKDAIFRVVEISLEEYNDLILINNEDPYFHCTNIQEQRMYNEVIYSEEILEKTRPNISNKVIYHGKELIRHPKRYIKNHYFMERYAI